MCFQTGTIFLQINLHITNLSFQVQSDFMAQLEILYNNHVYVGNIIIYDLEVVKCLLSSTRLLPLLSLIVIVVYGVLLNCETR